MWKRLGTIVIKNRLSLLIILFAVTGVMGYFASKVKLSYEFAKAIPVDNPKYQEYKQFREKFGDDGNVLVLGIQTDHFFDLATFSAYNHLQQQLKKVQDVEDVLSVPTSINLQKDSVTEKLNAVKIFSDDIENQAAIDSARKIFLNLPFYNSLLYNMQTNAYLMGVRINRDSLNSPKRSKIVMDITKAANDFEKNTKMLNKYQIILPNTKNTKNSE
jgi:predicted RND superfamily exporter protein